MNYSENITYAEYVFKTYEYLKIIKMEYPLVDEKRIKEWVFKFDGSITKAEIMRTFIKEAILYPIKDEAVVNDILDNCNDSAIKLTLLKAARMASDALKQETYIETQ